MIAPATDKYDNTNTIASLNDAEKIKAAIEEKVAGIIKNNKSVTAEVTVTEFVAASYTKAYTSGGIYYPEILMQTMQEHLQMVPLSGMWH